MIEMHGTIIIDMHQSACLIQKTAIERDTKFNRRQSDAAFHIPIGLVEPFNRLAAFCIIAGFGQLAENVLNNAIFNRLPIGRHTVIRCAFMRIEIPLPHNKRIKPQMMRNRIDNTFDANHALRPSKPPKGCVGLGIGAAPMRNNPHITDMIGVIGMTHGTRGNRL